jgi:Fe-S oxidoreductase
VADIKVPELKEYPVVPMPKDGVMSHLSPFVAKPEFQAALKYPGKKIQEEGQNPKYVLIDGWKEKAIDKMGDLLSRYRGFRVFMDSCVKCGACTDKCHYFLGTEDAKNMPVARQDLLRSVYRRYFTFAGKYFPKLVGARDLTEDVVNEWYSYFHQCSECRRCSVFCPYGIDTAEVTMAAREILAHIGKGQKYSNEIISKVFTIGNNLGLPEPALADVLEGLEEDVLDDTGVAVKFPLDQEGADVLLVTPSADFFAEPHIDGLVGYAKVFHATGTKWTLSSKASEAANFGLFIGSYENMQRISMRIREEAIRLGVKRIIYGECGHAWRVGYSFLNTLAGPFDFLDQSYPIPQHICEFTKDAIDKGLIKLDKSKNDDKVMTFHDSCNVARASGMGNYPGGQFDIPRAVIKAACNNFVDMEPGTTHDATFCCGGGGGLLTDDLMELRIKGIVPRASALTNVVKDHGVTHMAAICAICKSQFTKVLPYYGFTMDQIVSVHQLVSNAIVLEKTEGSEGDDE